MKRAAACLAALMAIGCTPISEQPHTQAQWQACRGEGFSADRAAACTAVAGDRTADPAQRALAYVERGRLRAEMSQNGRAIADFGRALRLDPQLAEALIGRAGVHAARGAYPTALRDYDAALALAPNNPAAIRGREIALQGRVDAVAAELAALTDALADNPRDPGLLNNRCWVRAVAGRELEIALADCNASLIAEPNNANTLDSRALVHLKRGALQDALRDYEAALALEPNDGHYLYGRGVVRRALGMNAEAAADFAAGERARPGVAELYRSYGV